MHSRLLIGTSCGPASHAIHVRSLWDLNNAVLGLAYSLVGAATLQVIIKMFIGGLRPNFYTACKPNLAKVSVGDSGQGYQNIIYDR